MSLEQNNLSILSLERDGQLLLVNTRYPRPIIIRKGIDYVKSFLENPVKEKDVNLYNYLVDHRIVTVNSNVPAMVEDFDCLEKKSLALYLLVTQKCNLSCAYCLAGTKGYRQSKVMTRELAFLSLDKAASSIKFDGSLEVIFFGGEPLLNWTLIKECLIYIESNLSNKHKDLKISFNMTSNMTLLPPDFIELAKKYRISILVDIDGPEKLHDSARYFTDGGPTYNKIAYNLERLSEAEIPFQMRATIFSGNVASLSEIVKLHKEMGAVSSGLPILIPVNSDGEVISAALYPDLQLYAKGIKQILDEHVYEIFNLFPPNVYAERILKGNIVQHGCGIARGAVAVVTSSGDVYPCIYLVGKPEFHLGNVLHEAPFSQSRFSKRFREPYEYLINTNNMEPCNTCSEQYLCGGGCPIRVLGFLNNTKSSDDAKQYFLKASCTTAKTSIHESLWYYANKVMVDYDQKNA